MSVSRIAPVFVASVAVALLLSGCGGPASPSNSPSSDASGTSAKPTVTVTPAASPTPTPTANTAAAPACTRDGLKITYQGTDNTAGHFHGVLTFTNTGAACSMNGFPIVYVGQPEAEEPMGAASTNDTASAPALVNLAPGASAHAAVTITDAGVVCEPVDTTYLLASPPLTHSFDWNADAEHVYNVNIGGCNDSSTSLIQVGAITG